MQYGPHTQVSLIPRRVSISPTPLLAQRVRDWIHDFYSSVVRLCDDANDTIAAAAFSAIGASLKAHPLCSTAVDGEIKSFWGEEEARGGRRVGGFTSQGGSEQGFNNHKEVCDMHACVGGGKGELVSCRGYLCLAHGHGYIYILGLVSVFQNLGGGGVFFCARGCFRCG